MQRLVSPASPSEPATALIAGLVLLLTACHLSGQGVGTPGGNGFVPRIEVDHRQVGTANGMHVVDVVPGTPVVLTASLVASPTLLAPLGLGPAVLEPDLGDPSALILPPFFAGATGRLDLPLIVPPFLAHVPVHFQAFAFDALAPFGGVAVSTPATLVFGLARDRHPVGVETAPGVFALAEIFPYGVLAASFDVRLADVSFVDLVLTNSNELAPASFDRPALDSFGGADAVLLPDGSRLVGIGSTTFESGIVRLTPAGGIETLVLAQGTAVEPALAPEIAASPFAPYLAVAAETPLAEYGLASLLLVRTDGSNVPGSHLSWVAVAAPIGLDIDASSLCFLDGALFFGDGEAVLYRCDLATLAVTPVVFPPSGGAVPVYVDESYAPAADGSAMAIGAGVDDCSHDVYVVTSAGVAVNVTAFPSDYEDAGPGQPDGIQLAMDATGQRVAYMHTVLETETFVRDVIVPAPPAHVTNPVQYIDSIDTVVGFRFTPMGTLVFAAGQNEDTADVYAAEIPAGGGPVSQIANLSATSGTTAPVFGLGATLELARVFSASTVAFLELDNLTGPRRLQVVDALGATLALDVGTLEAVFPLVGATAIVDRMGAGLVRVRTVADTNAPQVIDSWTSPAPAIVGARVDDPRTGAAALLAQGATGDTLVLIAANGTVTTAPGPLGTATGGLSFDGSGGLLAWTTDSGAGTTTIQRFDGATWSPASAAAPVVLAGRFLR